MSVIVSPKMPLLISLSSYQLVHWSLSPSLLEDHPLILSLPGPPVHPCPSLSIYSCLFSISCKSLLLFLAYLGFLSVYLSVPLNFFQFLHQLHFLIFSAVLNCSLFAGKRCLASLHLLHCFYLFFSSPFMLACPSLSMYYLFFSCIHVTHI